jgi:hypothetical protein
LKIGNTIRLQKYIFISTIQQQESLKGRDHSEDLGIDGRIILKWISGKRGWGVWIELIWLGMGTSGRLL